MTNKEEVKLTSIENRKNQHVEIAVNKDSEHKFGWGEFDDYQLEHCALPEISLSEIDTSTIFLGKKISFPFMISSITGGTSETFTVLQVLAQAAEREQVALGVGSQRIAVEKEETKSYFKIRKIAPTIPLLANLGAVQLNYGLDFSHCQKAVEMIEADALVLHLNPLHECLQKEGDTDFSNLLSKIAKLIKKVEVPIIIKEVGFGISPTIAKRLTEIGITIIDIAGGGGSSWPLIESFRTSTAERKQVALAFQSWGLPTAWLLEQYQKEHSLSGVQIIASGGIRNGVEIAKSIALGASLTGAGLPFLKASISGVDAVAALISQFKKELLFSMFATGSSNIKALAHTRVIFLSHH